MSQSDTPMQPQIVKDSEQEPIPSARRRRAEIPMRFPRMLLATASAFAVGFWLSSAHAAEITEPAQITAACAEGAAAAAATTILLAAAAEVATAGGATVPVAIVVGAQAVRLGVQSVRASTLVNGCFSSVVGTLTRRIIGDLFGWNS